MNIKTITITLTLSLTVSYIGLIVLYGLALTEGLNTKTELNKNTVSYYQLYYPDNTVDQSERYSQRSTQSNFKMLEW